MPGRQAHGRSLLPASGLKKPRKPSRGARASKALDAFAIAEEEFPVQKPKGVRMRDLDEEQEERSHKRHHGDDDDDDGDEDGGFGGGDGPRKKRARKDQDDEFEGFSGGDDDEGWHVGVEESDEDSEIDSDEAFGETDDERFQGYSFGKGAKKSKTKKRKDEEDEGEEDEKDEDEDEDDLESLGSDAIDLATALDQYESDKSDEDEGSGSEDEESSEDSGESDDDEEDPSKLDALQNMIAGFAGDDEEEEEESGPKGKPKISLKDLGLAGVKDPYIKKSLKLMNQEEKAIKPGTSKKLDVPLAKRQQDRLLRAAAYDKTKETLDRWIDTVKQNRRADHLVFPLAQNAHDAGLDSGELVRITKNNAGTELEQTILAIMEESGLGPIAKPPPKEEKQGEAAGEEKLSMAEQIELARQHRHERELHSREAARAKRIKKIKSKAYRRIHRKEALREQQLLEEVEGLDSDDEREALDRRRALERMGIKHKESKWAKLGKKVGRAVWDDEFRTSLTEMGQRKAELQKRIDGNAKGLDDDGDDDEVMSDASEDPESEKRRLLEELKRAAAYEDDEPQSGLMAMKFMQRGEEQRKKENESMVAELQRQLDSDDQEEPEEIDIGRRQFGMGKTPATNPFILPSKAKKGVKEGASGLAISDSNATSDANGVPERSSRNLPRLESSPPAPSSAPGAAGMWSRAAQETRKSKKLPKGKAEELDLSNATALALNKSAKHSKPKAVRNEKADDVEAEVESDEEDAIHLPITIRDKELLDKAFGGEDVVADFEREKAEIEKEDDDKEVDNTLPGWGGWVGEGISNREKKRHQGRFLTKVEGVKQKDRKDFKLKGVIIAEKRVKKNDKYLATQLPHPFESHHQYERSLRLPVGPEWSTKETFQESTKPRVLIKQGIIAPMSKPMA